MPDRDPADGRSMPDRDPAGGRPMPDREPGGDRPTPHRDPTGGRPVPHRDRAEGRPVPDRDPAEGRPVPGGEREPPYRPPGRRRPHGVPERVTVDRESVERGLAGLVLTVIELLRQLMERQALRRVEDGDLTDEQVERLGLTLMALERRMEELREHFGLEPEDLNIDLGPLGPLLPRDR
jgi:hypothetical protein